MYTKCEFQYLFVIFDWFFLSFIRLNPIQFESFKLIDNVRVLHSSSLMNLPDGKCQWKPFYSKVNGLIWIALFHWGNSNSIGHIQMYFIYLWLKKVHVILIIKLVWIKNTSRRLDSMSHARLDEKKKKKHHVTMWHSMDFFKMCLIYLHSFTL